MAWPCIDVANQTSEEDIEEAPLSVRVAAFQVPAHSSFHPLVSFRFGLQRSSYLYHVRPVFETSSTYSYQPVAFVPLPVRNDQLPS